MKIIHYSEAAAQKYSGDLTEGVTGRVVIGQGDGAENFCMRVFELSAGGFSARHSHEWEHEVFIHSGQGELYHNQRWVPLARGDVVFIPGNEEHQLKNAGEDPFVFVCVIPSGAPEI